LSLIVQILTEMIILTVNLRGICNVGVKVSLLKL
jgi:hypothetical protein